MTVQNDARFPGEDYRRHIMLDYRQMTEFVKEPFLVARADGIRFWDVYGKEYLDGLAGIFTVNVGYNNPRVLQAVTDQLRTLPFNPPMHGTNPRAVELANLLAEIMPGDLKTARLVSSGSEARFAAGLHEYQGDAVIVHDGQLRYRQGFRALLCDQADPRKGAQWLMEFFRVEFEDDG